MKVHIQMNVAKHNDAEVLPACLGVRVNFLSKKKKTDKG